MTGPVMAEPGPEKHVVDELIEERAERLRASPLWPVWRSVLYPLLRKPDAVRMADAIAPLSARQSLEHVSALLSLSVVCEGLDLVPRSGPVLVAATHPTGIADGIAIYDALKQVREDLVFFANRDAIRVNPRLAEMLIPVEWVEAKRTRERSRETLMAAVSAFEAGRCVVLFPSGRIAAMEAGRQVERPWLSTVAVFARKFACPVVPAHIAARNSRLYYWFWKINTELRDITLFHELLNKRGKRFEVRFGAPVPHDALPKDAAEAAEALRAHAAHDVPAGRPWRGTGRY